MLGFDYFTLLDHLTIARSRKHIEKYYGTSETRPLPGSSATDQHQGRCGPCRRVPQHPGHQPRNSAAQSGQLCAIALRPAPQTSRLRRKVQHSDPRGESFFRQVDREESLIHLLRVNVLKRMESAVSSFTLTVERQLRDVETTLARIEASASDIEEIDIADVDIDDPAFETLLVGRKVKVLLSDVDLIRWKQDLIEDRNRLATLLAAAKQVDAARDAKLAALREAVAVGIADIKAGRYTEFNDAASLRSHINGISKRVLAKHG